MKFAAITHLQLVNDLKFAHSPTAKIATIKMQSGRKRQIKILVTPLLSPLGEWRWLPVNPLRQNGSGTKPKTRILISSKGSLTKKMVCLVLHSEGNLFLNIKRILFPKMPTAWIKRDLWLFSTARLQTFYGKAVDWESPSSDMAKESYENGWSTKFRWEPRKIVEGGTAPRNMTIV